VRVLLAAALWMALTPWAHSQSAQKKDLEELRGRIEALQKELEKAEESKAEAVDALRESERAISQTNRRLFKLSAQRRELTEEMRKLGGEAQILQAEIQAEQEALGAMLRRQYVSGQPEVVRLILGRQDPNETARQLQYLSYIWRARGELIAELRQDLASLQQLSDRTERRSTELRLLEVEESAEKKRLEREKNARQQLLSRVPTEISQQRRQISTLKRDEQRLTHLIERLAKESARRKQRTGLTNRAVPHAGITAGEFGKLKGRLRLPVTGNLANRFGGPRQDGGLSWKGLFIKAPAGREIKAIAAGRVVYADWLRGFGNLLIIDHGEGYMSLYGNNEALLKQVGEETSPGEPVASVGNTGGSPESGLYFEMRYQGRPFDPLPWVRLR
jgi:septal ring factor EnvC (AmiA/AmiB activator)